MNTISEPTILALDAAGAACSAALWGGGALLHRRWEAMERGHAEALMPMADAVVAQAGFERLDLIAVSVGPGAYTGLRIAIAAARGLGLALRRPVIGIGSFDVHLRVARGDGVRGPVAVLLETKRTDFYLQVFDADDTPLGGPAVAVMADVERHLASPGGVTLAGDAVARFAAATAGPLAGRIAMRTQAADAAVVAPLAAAAFARAGGAELPPPRPMYMRVPDTSPPASDRQRLRG